ncbi:hypothetical protein AAZX31_04G166400 [Glycine max]|uniref:Uncharacterized protein n=1 Tax=Glycine max TaxID=3847 RepID=I1JX75_SOYBN|nr:uncharacterized protein LOC100789513 [Glycine max]KAG5049851.1 hypothetical protein JHK85_010954 [Glycine max]KAG5066918.1 hypothetical protein JHK86_010649 [Glycine max]KAH1254933.1 hypothetical protein GmHk_04G011263 [Glycine max]KRH63533.1 hypothetical protein GLYMA_04G183300v4 [Glycine max]|eukprot:XP_003522377.1 uncharacterized protein LOC100789513 [Glycine max]
MMHQQQEVEEEEASPHNKASPSPSFSSYSSETLAEIAARVIEELRHEPSSLSDDDDDALFPPWENLNDNENFLPKNDEPPEQNDDDDFEFAFVSRDLASPVSADDIFYNGQIKPMYPIFGVVPSNDAVLSFFPNDNNIAPTPRRRLPLRKLMFEEGETASCSSSTDESVDLEGVAEGAYCVWTPNSVGSERKKSNSTGSTSKRWKLRVRDLLLRSHSDGKNNNKQEQQKQRDLFRIATKPQNGSVGTEQQHHVEQNKRKSFLPYKPELVGLFTNANGLGRNLRPF